MPRRAVWWRLAAAVAAADDVDDEGLPPLAADMDGLHSSSSSSSSLSPLPSASSEEPPSSSLDLDLELFSRKSCVKTRFLRRTEEVEEDVVGIARTGVRGLELFAVEVVAGDPVVTVLCGCGRIARGRSEEREELLTLLPLEVEVF